ncbi:MAG: FUSC family protein, partial [Candidatus Dormibacteraeota bacterium]|nr:FUSC family protein [Candidatus Dormibacteraeota bacterium]MBO0762323.1 FUSC family protein [Candidatus Dormibacteraeota bacterium]
AFGLRAGPPTAAGPAVAAGLRLDDALRGFLTEQGSKRIPKEELWRLVGAALRLRLTARCLATLHDPDPETGRDGELAEQADRLAGWYQDLASLLARPPVRGRTEPGRPALDGDAADAALPTGPPSRVWVALHLEHLRRHLPDVVGPAEHAIVLRRRPWWR